MLLSAAAALCQKFDFNEPSSTHELGYRVEAVQTGFPDCEAKRRIGEGRWSRVRIEFEFLARSFRDHGHDPYGADLIVCWENNRPEAPIEILALKDQIQKIGNS